MLEQVLRESDMETCKAIVMDAIQALVQERLAEWGRNANDEVELRIGSSNALFGPPGATAGKFTVSDPLDAP